MTPKRHALRTQAEITPPKRDLPALSDFENPIELEPDPASVSAPPSADRENLRTPAGYSSNKTVSANDNSTAEHIAPSPSAVAPNTTLYLRIFTSPSGAHVDPITSYFRILDGQTALSEALHQKFHTDFYTVQEHQERYHNILEYLEVYLGDYQCLDMRIQTAQRASNCTYSMSEYRKEYACDQCILRRRLCVKPGKLDGRSQSVVHPLPLKLREGIQWQDVSYWVRP